MARPYETAARGPQGTIWSSHLPVTDSTGQGRKPAQSKSSAPTVAACVRRFCLDCQGLSSGRGAFDCESRICPLYEASPFRHVGRRRSSKSLVVRYCRHCQPEDRDDCEAADCALYPWRPWQPGGQPKARVVSESLKSHLRVIGQLSQFQDSRR